MTSSRGTAIDNFTVNQSSGKNIVLPAGSTQYTDQSLTFALQSTPDFSDYPYMASKSITGLTADMYATVTFSDAQVSSGQYAPFCQTLSGEIRLYAKSDVGAQTIPTISVGMDDSSAQQSMSNFVTLTGAQEITGEKTFPASTFFKQNGTVKDLVISSVDTSSASVNNFIMYKGYKDAGAHRIASDILQKSSANGEITRRFFAVGTDGSEADFRIVSSGYTRSAYRTYNASNVNDVVTIGMMKDTSTDANGYSVNGLVHNNGNESIGGKKTFTDRPTITQQWVSLSLKSENWDPANPQAIQDAGQIWILDKNGNPIGGFRFNQLTNGNMQVQLVVRNSDGSKKYITLGTGDVISS